MIRPLANYACQGGVQVRQDAGGEDGFLLLANTLTAQLSDVDQAAVSLRSVSQLKTMELQGQVFANLNGAQVQAETLLINVQDQTLFAPEGPKQVMYEGQTLTLQGELRANMAIGLLQAAGGAGAKRPLTIFQ